MNEVELSNKLNNAPIGSIAVDDIIGFCNIRREEGIDLDYKSDWPSDLGKVICSLANTQGGLILIGVDEEEKTRKPKLPIIGIAGKESVFYQQVMNIASDAVYPPVSPEIAVCELPEKNGRYVILIRILPSRLLHATDRRRKIYVRVADNSRGYDLANVSELEWLWERKTHVNEIREELYRSAVEHSGDLARSSLSAQKIWNEHPKLRVSIIPSFPNPESLIDRDKLLQVVRSLSQVKSPWKNVDRSIPEADGDWRSIPGGVCITSQGLAKSLQYVEFGHLAHMHVEICLPVENITNQDLAAPRFIWAFIILSYVDVALKFAHNFFRALEYSWPITVRADLETNEPMRISYLSPNTPFDPRKLKDLSDFCPDLNVSLLDIETTPSQLTDNQTLLLKSAYNLYWAFGLGSDVSTVTKWLANVA